MRRALFNHLGDFEIAATIVIGCAKHRHRAYETDAQSASPVEAVDDHDSLSVDLKQLPTRHADSGPLGKVERDCLPTHDVPVVFGRTRELRDRRSAVCGEDMRLWARPS